MNSILEKILIGQIKLLTKALDKVTDKINEHNRARAFAEREKNYEGPPPPEHINCRCDLPSEEKDDE